ncbi:hypothetical protein GOBAR_AA18624 [Gossypium barbadense]|uniref:Uncharacterized protein n=1 Tax=Gossypium barbadense TaxID=3634 RepID=A0A2P5XFF4_GOSBA|nr:hypothetical protein GOBAR_AA18624 [Gossypium barbadense]
MADIAKYVPVNGGTTVGTDIKSLFSVIKTRRTVALFMFAFVGNTGHEQLSDTNINENTTFAPPNTSTNNTQSSVLHANQTKASSPNVNENPPSTSNQVEKKGNSDVLKVNQTTPVVGNSPAKSDSSDKVSSRKGGKSIAEKGVVSNITASPTKKKKDNGSGSEMSAKQGIESLMESLMKCDLFDGEWVKDNSYPLYKPGSCSFIDEQFSCIINGRPDKSYQKLKWKPKGCTLPRLNGGHMLELLRGKRLVFVGDSLNRNMWESLDYNFTLEFFVSPFLVREWEMPDKNGGKKETLRLDLVGKSADQYKSADVLVFNTGHWWTHEKTSKGKDYYQEGSHVYEELNVLEAFRKALTTWSRWIDANVNPMKTMVFFRGYSASHFFEIVETKKRARLQPLVPSGCTGFVERASLRGAPCKRKQDEATSKES